MNDSRYEEEMGKTESDIEWQPRTANVDPEQAMQEALSCVPDVENGGETCTLPTLPTEIDQDDKNIKEKLEQEKNRDRNRSNNNHDQMSALTMLSRQTEDAELRAEAAAREALLAKEEIQKLQKRLTEFERPKSLDGRSDCALLGRSDDTLPSSCPDDVPNRIYEKVPEDISCFDDSVKKKNSDSDEDSEEEEKEEKKKKEEEEEEEEDSSSDEDFSEEEKGKKNNNKVDKKKKKVDESKKKKKKKENSSSDEDFSEEEKGKKKKNKVDKKKKKVDESKKKKKKKNDKNRKKNTDDEDSNKKSNKDKIDDTMDNVNRIKDMIGFVKDNMKYFKMAIGGIVGAAGVAVVSVPGISDTLFGSNSESSISSSSDTDTYNDSINSGSIFDNITSYGPSFQLSYAPSFQLSYAPTSNNISTVFDSITSYPTLSLTNKPVYAYAATQGQFSLDAIPSDDIDFENVLIASILASLPVSPGVEYDVEIIGIEENDLGEYDIVFKTASKILCDQESCKDALNNVEANSKSISDSIKDDVNDGSLVNTIKSEATKANLTPVVTSAGSFSIDSPSYSTVDTSGNSIKLHSANAAMQGKLTLDAIPSDDVDFENALAASILASLPVSPGVEYDVEIIGIEENDSGEYDIAFKTTSKILCDQESCKDALNNAEANSQSISDSIKDDVNDGSLINTINSEATKANLTSVVTTSSLTVGAPSYSVVDSAGNNVQVKTAGNNTQVPTPATPASSPPPTDMSTRRIAEKMNQFYNISRNVAQGQDQEELREQLEKTFDNAPDVEDIFINSRFQSPIATASQFRRHRMVVQSDSRDDSTYINGENYYDDLPEFVTQSSEDPLKCKCVDCEEDQTCGGLWKGNRYPGTYDLKTKKIYIVVSHCKSDLYWVSDFIKGYNIVNIHVISKCGVEVEGAPEAATIERLPNNGRCDHTYAYYIDTVLEGKLEKGKDKDSIVVFFKDDISLKNFHQSGSWNKFESLLQLSSSDNGFGCGVIPDKVHFGANDIYLSTYHETKTLFEFSMKNYSRNMKGYATDEMGLFKSSYVNLGSWYASLGTGDSPPEVVQVCYGGVFAASVTNIKRRNVLVWKAMEKSLARGNNIQEGHFAERSWASLLSTTLQPFQIEALLNKANGVYVNKSSMHGALLKMPKLYLHVGVEGTLSSNLLTESLVKDIDKLESDGYNVAVHGKWDGGVYSFPNIDRLGSCMWSDMNKSLFPEHLKEATICPHDVLPELAAYMKRLIKESQDLVILNPWLVRQGTAEGLGTFFDPAWDVYVVIYYRRYFEWITIEFEIWRQDLLENSISPHFIPFSSFRYIDFLRLYCKRLFYGKEVIEDGFPVRKLSRVTATARYNQRLATPGKVYYSEFDPTTNFEVKELTDLQEYTYFVARQYYAQPRFRHGIEIVNYHDVRGPETNFYCHILHDAHNACKAAVERDLARSEPSEMQNQDFVQLNPIIPFKPAQAFEDIAIAAYEREILQLDDTKSQKRFTDQILLWMDMIDSALQNSTIPITNLPLECLFQFEIDRLLEVSLAYEKALLPGFFSSSKGSDNMQNEFSKWRFCSVDTAAILEDPKWEFLFKDKLDFAISEQPKAYIHIGVSKTGSSSIQDTMAMDRGILKQDKYFLAVHGQVRKPGSTDYIIDNILVQCDKLGACVWSDEERQIVMEGSGNVNAGVCPEYLLPTFDKFLSKAVATKSSIVISNEWLNRRTSETGLLKILEGWDPTVVIYYRRFYDWMISAHFQWHFDLGIASLESLQGKVRLIDFMRMFCGRLFASKVVHSPDDSDLSFADLTDIQEYTYHAWKRYKSVPQYEDNIKIVNFHDGHIIKSFYCDVLGAEKACEVETKRLEQGGSINTRSKTSTAYVDLAIGLHWKDHNLLAPVNGDGGGSIKPITMKDFIKLGNTFKKRMTARGLNENDLPKECLSESEQALLLNVSLAYEKILLPVSYASGGEEATRQHFGKTAAKNKFCSVDLDRVLSNPKWKFLVKI